MFLGALSVTFGMHGRLPCLLVKNVNYFFHHNIYKSVPTINGYYYSSKKKMTTIAIFMLKLCIFVLILMVHSLCEYEKLTKKVCEIHSI